MPYTCCTGPYISLMQHPGGGRTFPALKGGSYGPPPVPCTTLLPPPSLLGQLLRDLPPTLPSPKDAPGPCGAPPAPPSATTTQNSSAPTSALVFNGPFFPGAEGGSPSPALHPYYFFFSMPLFPGGALVAPHPSLLPGGWLRPLNVGWGRPGPGFRMKGGAIGAARSGLGPCQAAEPSFYGGDSAELSPGSRPVGRAGTPLLSPRRLQAALLGAGGAAPLQSPPPFCPGICGDGGGGDAGGGHKGVPNTWVVAQRSLPRGGGDFGVPRGGSMGWHKEGGSCSRGGGTEGTLTAAEAGSG